MSKRGKALNIISKRGGRGAGGILFQAPPGWTDGSKKLKYLPKGHPHAGRVYFTSAREAQDIAKRLEDQSGVRVRYNPD